MAVAGLVGITALAAQPLSAQSCIAYPVSGAESTVSAALVGNGTGYGISYGTRDAYLGTDYTPSQAEGLPGALGLRGAAAWELGGETGEGEAPRPYQLCALMEFASLYYDDITVASASVGPGVAYQMDALTLMAAPMLSASAFTGPYAVLLRTSAAYRSGRWYGGTDLTFGSGGMGYTLRGGYVLGSAAEPVATAPAREPGPPTVAPAEPTAEAAPPAAGTAPYSLDDVKAMLVNGVPTSRILQLATRACLDFRMNDAAVTELRRHGADPELLRGLAEACYSAP